ncbi:hypothetical protein HMPREF9141_2342 [Prevotella multiformis DSM 16608]|uniref:Uncharacterized protein n=1 Tax=Prevotella multiformis DSM 16608 TaxID=888743 RepID=F0F9S5_9BACT|nr:hypothetical protein HMPREF9141_2342 [Prevotella multiformis DSM 16608]
MQQKAHGGKTERRKEQQAGMPPVASPLVRYQENRSPGNRQTVV